jgi:hypothetical protein
VLVSPHDGGVDHHVLVVVIARQKLEKALENPALRPPAEPLVDDFPIAKAFGQITPGNAGTISVQNRFHEQPIIRCRATDVAFAAGRKSLIRSHWSSRNA